MPIILHDRNKHTKNFRKIPFPKWPETWKCICGSYSVSLCCPNCKRTQKDNKEMREVQKYEKFLSTIDLDF